MAKSKTPENAESPTSSEQTKQDTEAKEPVGTGQPEISKNATNMAMLCHLLAIFTAFIGPLIIWLMKKDDDPFINDQGKEALNFQITVLIAMIASGLLSFVCIGFILMPLVWIVDLVFCIIASIKASGGQAYRYPLSIRLVK